MSTFTVEPPNPTTTALGDTQHNWSFWDGERFRNRYFAMDCETVLIEGREISDIVLASASDGEQHFIIRPLDLPQFVEASFVNSHVVFHSCGFDFWVLDKYLHQVGATTARGWLWTVVEQGRMHDTMLLSGLIGLAKQDNMLTLAGQEGLGPSDNPKLPSLAELAEHQLGIKLPKDKYRLTYHEIVNQDWSLVDQGYFEYAVRDSIITYQLYCLLSHQAKSICDQHQASREYGFLSESIQVKAAVCLESIGRRGLKVDQSQCDALLGPINNQIEFCVKELSDIDPELFKRYRIKARKGELMLNKDNGLPMKDRKVLQSHLERVEKEHSLKIERTSKGISTSVKEVWSKYRNLDPVANLYCDLETAKKKRSFINELPERLTSKYNALVRTGRTSCYAYNLQQFDKRMREVLTASPGCYLLVIDYSALELRTLAAWCEFKFGFSKLGEVLRKGIDPHCSMAAMLLGISYEEFMALKATDKQKYLATRQASKAVNFGNPGGLGAKTFVEWAAKPPYNVELTTEQAKDFKAKWLTAYPEMRLHLRQQGRGDCETAVTPTGRIRSQVRYCSARNFPFQGLAGDGCKLAMWNLLKAGYDVQGFIHDEFVIELSSFDACKETADDIDRICCESMAEVCGTVPIACEYALTFRWVKDAEAVFDESGQLQVWNTLQQAQEEIDLT